MTWTPEIVEALLGTGAVHTIDFKGQYELQVEDAKALAALYELLIEAFPDALLEDPHDLPEITPLVEPHAARVSYDAPIHTVADLDAVPSPPGPSTSSRAGSASSAISSSSTPPARTRGLAMYGGGMGELGVARGQIQLLAVALPPRRAQRHRPARLQRARPRRRAPGQPAGPAARQRRLPPRRLERAQRVEPVEQAQRDLELQPPLLERVAADCGVSPAEPGEPARYASYRRERQSGGVADWVSW